MTERVGEGLTDMTGVQEIEERVRRLSPKDLAAFRAWFAEFDGETWDRQFEQDVAASRLDQLAEEAVQDLHAGRSTDR